MIEPVAQCPAVPIPERGTVGHSADVRDAAWDSGGTSSLKALARRIIARDTGWDGGATNAPRAVPPATIGRDARGTAVLPGSTPRPATQNVCEVAPSFDRQTVRAASAQSDAWRDLPFGRERGRAFSDARMEPGACRCCAGRRWWTEAEQPTGWRCAVCHPPDHLPALAIRFMPDCSSGARPCAKRRFHEVSQTISENQRRKVDHGRLRIGETRRSAHSGGLSLA
jgi:hypothetical protein